MRGRSRRMELDSYGVVKMSMYTDSGFRLLPHVPPPGRTVPRNAQQGHHVAAIAA